ncbi:uncharacterized protein LOC108200552 isoform X2 [Daucus carota subsp. sativus]|uniref:uncharacterized protein LOC108200552 isoform X2 n=1 Tax=Daucus carota subsp. sativus TaxID=79200 RepID=UPI0030837D18
MKVVVPHIYTCVYGVSYMLQGDLEQRGRVLSALATFTILQEPLRISPDSGNHPLSHLMGSVCGMRDVQMMAVNGGLTETCGLSGIGYPDEMKDGWFVSVCYQQQSGDCES